MKFELTPKMEAGFWGAIAGAAALAAVGFMFGGWVTGGKAAEMAKLQSEKAVVTVLAPICVEKFRQAKNAEENLTKLKTISYAWDKGTYVREGGWATFPGNPESNSAVAQACAEMLGTPAK